ncbi:hypothetical protein Hypma_015165 [Hypsizygus marmoreus]|uniref:Uncharacterized protein n=1 Tax=Hypsizygus marmoreus TaxID=39966 RepID=A0A369K184_HYPMA|nr:hypothetical protein Hypma_015165 [Hypsizygus marmoreus]
MLHASSSSVHDANSCGAKVLRCSLYAANHVVAARVVLPSFLLAVGGWMKVDVIRAELGQQRRVKTLRRRDKEH